MKNTTIQLIKMTLVIILLISFIGSVKPKMCDWTQSNGNEANSAYIDIDINQPFVELWKETPEYVGYRDGSISMEISGSPVTSEDRLVLISCWSFEGMPLGPPLRDYILSCFKIEKTGLEPLWHQLLPGGYSGATPAIVDNKVVCSSDVMLHCFDLETGDLIWEVQFSGSPVTPTVMSDEKKIAVVTAGGTLSLVDIPTGEILWRKIRLEDVQCHYYGTVTAGDGRLFVCYRTSDEEGVAALNYEGDLLWKQPGRIFHKNVDDYPFITLYTGGILFAVGFNPTTLFAFDAESGDVLWTYEGKILLNALSSNGKTIYVYSKTDEGVLCLDVHTGKEIWKSPPLFVGDKRPGPVIDKSLISTRNCVLICRHTYEEGSSAKIFALDSTNGALIWESEELENLTGPLIMCNKMIIAKVSKSLYAFGELDEMNKSKPPETTPPETTLDTPLSIMILVGALIGIFILFYSFIQKKRTG